MNGILKKTKANLKKHGISFDEARYIFGENDALHGLTNARIITKHEK